MKSPFFVWCWAIVLLCGSLSRISYAQLKWSNVGPGGGGWIEALTADPHDPGLVYLGCDVGGFYISHDGGANWEIHNTGLDDYFVECIAVHPQNSQIILLGMEGGVYKSSDGGNTWKNVRSGFPAPMRYAFSAPIGAVAFDPSHPNIIYAGIGRPRWGKEGKGQIYKSTDTGETWTLCTPTGTLDPIALVSALQVAPDGSYVIAATNKGIYRSIDGGVTWQAANNGLPHNYIEEVAIAPSRPQTVYCTLRTTARDDAAWNGGVYRSDDGGLTWQARSTGLASRVGKSGQPAQMSSSYEQIAVDALNPDIVYVGDSAWVTAGVYKTTDGGGHWTYLTRKTAPSNMDYGWITQWGPSVESLTISPADPSRLWFGTSGQVFQTNNGGTSWTQRYTKINADGTWSGNGLEVTCLNSIMTDPHRPNRVLFGYMDIGLLISDDNGRSFRNSNEGMKFKGNCFTVAFDPTDANTLWAGTGEWGANHGDVCRSTDAGKTWQPVGTPATGLPDGQTRNIVIDPSSAVGHRTLYVTSNSNGIFKSTNGGTSWQSINVGLPEAARQQPRSLVLDSKNPQHLRLALGGNTQIGSGLWETRDGGATWTHIVTDTLFSDIKQLQADPVNFDTLYLCQRESRDASQKPPVDYQGGLFKSTDGGQHWQRIFDFHFVSSIAFDPSHPGTLYLATIDHAYHDGNRATGVWKSTDSGQHWQAENTGLTHWNINSLHFGHSRLWAGTQGNSVFVAEVR